MTNTAGCVEAVDGAPGDQGQEERHEAAVRAGGGAVLSLMVTSETWNSRPVRDL